MSYYQNIVAEEQGTAKQSDSKSDISKLDNIVKSMNDKDYGKQLLNNSSVVVKSALLGGGLAIAFAIFKGKNLLRYGIGGAGIGLMGGLFFGKKIGKYLDAKPIKAETENNEQTENK